MISLLTAVLLLNGIPMVESGPTYNPNAPAELYVLPETGPQREQRQYEQRQFRMNSGQTDLQREQNEYERRQRRIWCADHPGTC
jgi:nitric oxide reductase activation protein